MRPASGDVSVDGERRELEDGYLKLSGVPGDRFEVAVTVGEQQPKKMTVFITRDGTPSVDTIDATASASASAEANADAGAAPTNSIAAGGQLPDNAA